MTRANAPGSPEALDSIALPVVATDGDRRLAGLVSAHFRDLLEREPVLATYLGIHELDDRLGDLSRAAHEDLIASEHRFLADLEAIDRGSLSTANALELEMAVLGARRAIFDEEVHRTWERRVTAGEGLGDALFLLFARDFAPLDERLDSIAARLEAAPLALRQVRDRLGAEPVTLWLELELEAVASLPDFLGLIADAASVAYGADGRRLRRLERATAATKAALEDYAGWIRGQLPRAGSRFALGRERLDELIGLRAFDGLTADEILDIGWEQLRLNHEARRVAAAELDPGATEHEVLERVKGDHPATFDEALAEYRDVMARARAFIEERGLATIPEDAPLDVIATPEYLRRMTPFAAYFAPAAFDRPRRGIYIVTPSVDDDPGAMLEHNRASISNTSIHEA
ncbi:MAG: DUF885 family protein, partial [Chloroflexota bacterium]